MSSDVAIVEPPPEIKRYVEMTARFLSNQNLDVEKYIMESNKNDPNLCFFKTTDPYHAYYKNILAQYRANGAPAIDDVWPPIRDVPPLPLPEEEPAAPKKQKLVDESSLVPQDKFLAQHPGLSTIIVYVPNTVSGDTIEIPVQSLLETVGSLKEKIAAIYHHQLTVDRLKLTGKTPGYLSDSKSLAHYNVGPGDILTLEMVNVIQTMEELYNFAFRHHHDV